MPSATLPLQDLAQRIDDQEAELTKLRKEFETRQAKLAELTRHKEELETQLQKVESAMQSVSQLDRSSPAPKQSMSRSTESISLPKFIVQLLQEAKRPMTIKEVAQEVVRQNYPSTSKNLSAMVETRVSELLRKGILQRTRDQSGVVPAGMPSSTKPTTSSPNSSTGKSNPSKPPAVSKPAAKKTAELGPKVSLKQLLAQVLATSSRPLTASELADKVLATGYQTKSKDFKNVIWVGVGNLDNIEHVPGQGYRLKKGPGKR